MSGTGLELLVRSCVNGCPREHIPAQVVVATSRATRGRLGATRACWWPHHLQRRPAQHSGSLEAPGLGGGFLNFQKHCLPPPPLHPLCPGIWGQEAKVTHDPTHLSGKEQKFLNSCFLHFCFPSEKPERKKLSARALTAHCPALPRPCTVP